MRAAVSSLTANGRTRETGEAPVTDLATGEGSGTATREQRLFFAIWPRVHEREPMLHVQKALRISGRPVPPDNLHMTLAFIGRAERDYATCLREAAAMVQSPAFTLTLDSIGYFRKPRIAWAGPSQLPESLASLHARLLQALAACGYTPGEALFRPHVTLFRKASHPVTDVCSPVSWCVDSFALVESQLTASGARYVIVERYALTTNGAGE